MSKRRSSDRTRKPLANQRRGKPLFAEAIRAASYRAQETSNRRSGRREMKSVRAAIAAADFDEGHESAQWSRRLMRWLVGMMLLPLCWVTTWTLLSRFSHATVEQGFWQTAEFWYFAVGALLMGSWFAFGLARTTFLFIYVLGHELTHAVFVILFRGRIGEFKVTRQGGYITTNKTNLIIALSPYFVPFWSVMAAAFYGIARVSLDLEPSWDRALYLLMGITWTFHLIWTVWMLPRDQPDLRDNGTFLSLVVIYLANLLVLVGLLCLAEESPLANAREFVHEWVRHAATWVDAGWRWLAGLASRNSGLP
jgi:hypothetical protein